MKKRVSKTLVLALLLMGIITIYKIDVEAAVFGLNGNEYIFYEDNDQDYDTTRPSEIAKINNGNNAWGSLVIEGDAEKISENKFNVKGENITISYIVNQSQYSKTEYDWNIKSDWEDDVDNMELSENISCGAIIIRTSYDGINWVFEKSITDVFKSGSSVGEKFYIGNNIQLLNGCYYQIMIAYRQTKRLDDTKFLFADTSDWEDRYILEKYEFYAENTEEKNIEAKYAADNKKSRLGSKVKVEKNSGYRIDRIEDIDRDDPHYGWELGSFFVKGYTAETNDQDGNKVFMKNVGDKVRLYFNLTQNIYKLNNNEDLSIEEDNGGYDKYFEINKTNFKHGTLIVRYTDSEGVKSDPIIYTNFLEALSHPGADTKIDLFEEGDYEVALDYKILNERGIDTTTDYRIYFSFSIRNGNCKAFIMDAVNKSELKNKAYTSNGFSIDLASSKYLKCDVAEYSLEVSHDTYDNIALHPVGHKVAKDQNVYKNPGKYVLTIKNPSADTDEIIEIYVGGSKENEKYIKALAKNVNTLEEINKLLAEGGIVSEDGTIAMPTPTPMPTPIPTPSPIPTVPVPSSVEPMPSPTTNLIPSAIDTHTKDPISNHMEEPIDVPDQNDRQDTEVNSDSNVGLYILFAVIGVGIGIAGAVIVPRLIKDKKESKENSDGEEKEKKD